MSEIKEYKINVIDNEHIEGVDVEQNVQIADLFEKAVAGNYKYYRTIGLRKPIGNGEYGCKIYSYDETAKKGSYANTTIEKSPDLWFENPHYVAVESDLITETTIDETESDLVEPVEVEMVEPEQFVEEKVETAPVENDGVDYKALYEEQKEIATELFGQVGSLTLQLEETTTKLNEANAVIETFANEKDTLTAKANAYDNLQSALAVLKSFLA